MATISSKSGSTIRPSQEGFEEKSKRLKRPISPHLSVYKWRNNMILSMMHRFTGIALYNELNIIIHWRLLINIIPLFHRIGMEFLSDWLQVRIPYAVYNIQTIVACYFFAVAILLPESYPYYIGILEEMHFKEFVLSTAKFLIAFPFSYHLLNGVRHLIWDVGYLWTIKEINISCYIVVVLALALAIHLTTL